MLQCTSRRSSPGFSRYHKHTLGAELRNQSRAVVSAIVKANSEVDKLPSLLALRDRLEELTRRVMSRIHAASGH